MSRLTAVIILVSVILLFGIVAFQSYQIQQVLNRNFVNLVEVKKEVSVTPSVTPEVTEEVTETPIIEVTKPATNSSNVQ